MKEKAKGSGGSKSNLQLYMRLKAQELYWSLCTLVGLKHLHDGSRAKLSVAEATPTIDQKDLSRIKIEEEKRINRLIDEAATLQLSRTSKYLRERKQDLVMVAVRERTTPEPSKLPSPFVYAMQ